MRTVTPRRPSAGQNDARTVGILLVIAVGVGAIGGLSGGLGRAVVGLLAIVIIVVLAFDSPTLTLVLMVVWLASLGFARRALIPFVGWSDIDPLLLVSPAAAAVLLIAMRHRAPPPRTFLGSVFSFQLLWILASSVNPEAGPIGEAVKALLFFVSPVLWFYVGRRIGDREHDIVMRAITWMGVPIVALGLYQTFVGLLPFELTWVGVANVNPAVLFVEGFHIRPFSTMASPQEYGVALAFVLVTLWARFLYGRRSRSTVIAMAIVAGTLFLQGSRGTLLSAIFAVGLMWAVKRRSPVVVLVAIALTFIASFVAAAGADVTMSTTNVGQKGTTDALIHHQLSGLANPSSSTFGLHVRIYAEGIRQGLEHPFGLGPTKNKFEGTIKVKGEEQSYSPEGEFPISLIALGLPGGLALLAVYLTSVRYAFGLQRWQPGVRHLSWLGFLVAGNDQMLNGRLYFTSAMVGIAMGGLARDWAALRELRTERG